MSNKQDETTLSSAELKALAKEIAKEERANKKAEKKENSESRLKKHTKGFFSKIFALIMVFVLMFVAATAVSVGGFALVIIIAAFVIIGTIGGIFFTIYMFFYDMSHR